ncbi:volume-regulated anion channel subunit LRRC8E-like [Petromyzon marinus]|uniref:volume-regulated anion channel subunit LRRC8E-like n=1 Tax=Petromyzon marinus TaxID=7757 RepID=UPI003F6FC295
MIPIGALTSSFSLEGHQDLKILQPWWDVLCDMLSVPMFMIGIFAVMLQNMNERILCVPVPSGFDVDLKEWNETVLRDLVANPRAHRTGFDQYQYRLINQFCYDNAVLWISKYFPHLVVLHTLVLTATRNFWFRFPETSSKIEHFVSVLGKCMDSQWTTHAVHEAALDGVATTAAALRPSLPATAGSCSDPRSGEIPMEKLPPESPPGPPRPSVQFVDPGEAAPPDRSPPGQSEDRRTPSDDRILDKKEGEQAKALFEKVKKLRAHTEAGGGLHRIYVLQTAARLLQALVVLAYTGYACPNMRYHIHCVEGEYITGYGNFYCVHGLWRIFRMMWMAYATTMCVYALTCAYVVYWVVTCRLKEYSFAETRQETGVDDIPDVRNDFAFLLHLVDKYDPCYASKFSVFLSEVSENKLRQVNVDQAWTLSHLTGLLEINAQGESELRLCKLAAVPVDTYRLTQIQVLTLNSMHGVTLGAAVVQLVNLHQLRLLNCTVSVDNRALAFLSEELHQLEVKFAVKAEVPGWLREMRHLEELSLEGPLTPALLKPLGGLRRLRSLRLTTSVARLPPGLAAVAGGGLRAFALDNGGVRLESPAPLSKLRGLETLRLTRCGLEPAELPRPLLALGRLSDLDLSRNGLRSLGDGDDASLPAAAWERLAVLRLSDNALVSVPRFAAGAGSPALRSLFLDGNLIEGELPAGLLRLHGLRVLDLSRNAIAALPPDVWLLTQLSTLLLSGNALRRLPDELFRCEGLRTLALANNELCELSGLVGRLRRLRRLELVGNRLTELPAELGECAELRRGGLVVEEELFESLPARVKEAMRGEPSRTTQSPSGSRERNARNWEGTPRH